MGQAKDRKEEIEKLKRSGIKKKKKVETSYVLPEEKYNPEINFDKKYKKEIRRYDFLINKNKKLALKNNYPENLEIDEDQFLTEEESMELYELGLILGYHNPIEDKMFLEMFEDENDNPNAIKIECKQCEGSGYHYLITKEELKENPDLELYGEIRCYKCGGDGNHIEGFEGYVNNSEKYVPYKE